MKKLLFTGGGGAGNIEIWDFYNNSYELHFADSDPDNINPLIPHDRKHKIPFARSNRFIENLTLLCKQKKIDILIPGVDEELISILKNKSLFGNVKILLPNIDFTESMINKFSMFNHLKNSNISVPETVRLSDFKNELFDNYIIKPIKGRGSRNIFFPKDSDEVLKFKALLSNPREFIVQRRIIGTEYTVQVISDLNEELKAIIPIKVLLKRGITIKAVTENNKKILKVCKKIHSSFTTNGIYNVQLIVNKNNEVFPFEINPRISTTFCLAINASKYDPIELATSNSSSHNDLLDFKSNLSLNRSWNNIIS